MIINTLHIGHLSVVYSSVTSKLYMVTKRRDYLPKSRLQLIDRPVDIIEAYSRESQGAIVTSVRCDQRISRICFHDEHFLKQSDGPFLLSKIHYDILLFSFRSLKLTIDLSYSSFLQKLHQAYESVKEKENVIIQLKITFTGKIEAKVTLDNAKTGYFDGLLDQMVAKMASDGKIRKEDRDSLKPTCVKFDTDATLPSQTTSFNLENQVPYELALSRTSAKVQKNFSEESDVSAPNKHFKADYIPLMFNPLQLTLSAGEWIPALFRDNRWLVPHICNGGHNDALRVFLLECGLVHECQIKVQGFNEGEDILLISASRGIRRGIISGKAPDASYKYTRVRRNGAKLAAEKKYEQAVNAQQAQRISIEVTQGAQSKGIPNTHKFRII